jgi:acyl carrier protein
MKRETIIQQIKEYISTNILRGKHIELDAQTPLLEWGIINSIDIMRLITFINDQFQVHISTKQMVTANFSSIEALADFVERSLAEL